MFVYLSYDNLLDSQNVDSTYVNMLPYLSLIDATTVNFNINYPSARNDSTILSIIGDVTETPEYIQMNLDSTIYIKLDFINDNVKELVYEYFNDIIDKYKLLLYYFRLYSLKNNYYNLDPSEFVTQKKPIVNNAPIIDFIQVDNTDITYFSNNNIALVYIYGKYQITTEREMFYSVLDEYIPSYIFECVDSTTDTTTYQKIQLDVEYISPNNNKYYKINKITDLTSISDSDYILAKNLPLLLKNSVFQKYLNDNLSQFDEVNIIFKIVNRDETNSQLQYPTILYKNKQYLNQKSAIKIKYDLIFNNINNINNHSDRVYFIDVTSVNLTNIYNNVDIIFNDSTTELYKLGVNRIISNTKNYIILNGYLYETKLDITSSSLYIIIKNLTTDFDVDVQNIKVAMDRHKKNNSSQFFIKNCNDFECDNYINNMYILIAQTWDFTNSYSNVDVLISDRLQDITATVLGVELSDLTSKMDLLNNIEIKTWYIQTSMINHLFYLQFTNKDYNGYLYKYILSDYIDLIIDKLMLSFYSYHNGMLYKYNMKLTRDMITEVLTETYNKIYIFNILNSGIIFKYNGIFSQQKYEKQFKSLYDKIHGDSLYNNFSINH